MRTVLSRKLRKRIRRFPMARLFCTSASNTIYLFSCNVAPSLSISSASHSTSMPSSFQSSLIASPTALICGVALPFVLSPSVISEESVEIVPWSSEVESLDSFETRARIVGPAPERQIPNNPGCVAGVIVLTIFESPGICQIARRVLRKR